MRFRSVALEAQRNVAHPRRPAGGAGLAGLSRAVARGVLSVSLGAWCAPALADGPIAVGDATEIVATAERDVAKAGQELTFAKNEIGTAAGTPAATLDRRIREGEINFLLEDYLRAAVTLLDVVENEGNRSHPRYDDASYFLATSLAKLGNYGESRRLYELMLDRARGPRLKDVVTGLLEVANATRRYENVERYVARLREAGGLSGPEVDYIHGKTLFQSAATDSTRLQSAYDTFKRIPGGTPLAAQGAYYAGVVLVSMKKYREALPEFEAALQRAGQTDSERAVRDLANVALGRVFFELDELDKAVDAYRRVGRSSAQFQDMLFELAWAHVKAAKTKPEESRAAELEKALRMAELLMASGPAPTMFPEARILEGNLQIRLGAADSAYDTFQDLIDRYGGARYQLAELVARNPDPRQFFDQLIGADLSNTGSTDLLPPVAVDWALTMPEMKQAVGVLSDLKTSESYAKDSRELITTLELALGGEARFALAGLGKARQKMHAASNRAMLAIRNLLDVEHRMIAQGVSGDDAAQLAAARAQRAPLEAALQNLPTSADDAAHAGADATGAYREAEQRVYRQSIEINSMRAQIAAIDVWIGQHRDTLAPTRVEELRQRLVAARDDVKAMDDELAAMRGELRVGADVASGDGGRGHGVAVRRAYLDAVASEGALLKSMRAKAPVELAGLLPRIDAQRAAAEQVVAQGNALDADMEPLVSVRVAELRAIVEAERGKLDGYEQQGGVLRAETDAMLGPVAADSLSAVAAEFNDLVLKADVGIIDVAWARKQGVTDKVSTLVRELQDKTRELEIQFSDVLDGN